MKKYLLLIIFYLQHITFSYSQNIGVGNSNPQEKLDVSGNINVTGTIKTNGVDGTAGQVLMKNNNNLLSWATICDFKSMATFIDTSVLSSQWNIPAGVTKKPAATHSCRAGLRFNLQVVELRRAQRLLQKSLAVCARLLVDDNSGWLVRIGHSMPSDTSFFLPTLFYCRQPNVSRFDTSTRGCYT